VTREEILQDLAHGFGLRPGKILTLSELLPRLKEHRNRHERVAVANGCFDVLHIGHLHTIRFAKSQAEVLVVAINSDASVQRIKGRGRPIVTQYERAQVLAALEDVDYVVVFEDDTPVQLLRELKPDVLVKGGDYDTTSVVGADVVDEWQGRVVLGPRIEGVSTTSLVKTIKNTLNS
jgi:D-beta-D-heptose 7-phosphate kinase/D-beta-D-heptose 1-phosphate adenosyltransferase